MTSISIIIPLFNHGDHIEQLVLAFSQQAGPNDEICVVDDCSTDSGVELIKRLTIPNLKVLMTERNSGPATARNLGARSATSDFLLFFDADDLPHPQLLACLKYAIDRFPTEQLFAVGINYEERVGEGAVTRLVEIPRMSILLFKTHVFAISCLSFTKPLCTASSTCIKADAFRAQGGFQAGLRYSEDPELWARLSAVHRTVYIDYPLAFYRYSPSGLSYLHRGSLGSVAPYVETLQELSKSYGSIYSKLATMTVTKNVIWARSSNAPSSEILAYLKSLAPSLVASPSWIAAITPNWLIRSSTSLYRLYRQRLSQPINNLPKCKNLPPATSRFYSEFSLEIEFSVIIPIYQGSTSLPNALDSLVRQTHRNFEVIIVDDGSNDYPTTFSVVQNYIDRIAIRVFRNEKHTNGSVVRNRGIAEARGRYVAFLDADDTWVPNRLEFAHDLIDRIPEKHFIIYGQVELLRSHPTGALIPWRAIREGELVSEYVFGSSQVMSTITFVLPTDFARLVLFDERLERHQDSAFMMRAQAIGAQFVFQQAKCGIYNFSAADLSKRIKTGRISSQRSSMFLMLYSNYFSKSASSAYRIFVVSRFQLAERQYVAAIETILASFLQLSVAHGFETLNTKMTILYKTFLGK